MSDILFYFLIGSVVVLVLNLFRTLKQDGVIILNKSTYIDIISNSYAVCMFQGSGWGSYKTFTMVLTGWFLLKSGKYQRVYANFPVSYASSPPINIEKFDFTAPYAEDSIFLFDEVWKSFAEYDPEKVKEVFAYPRKSKQCFLMSSVLPIQDFKKYTRGYVTKVFNYQTLGIPILQMKLCSVDDINSKAGLFGINYRNTNIFVIFPSLVFGWYMSKFKPTTIEPIKQYRDSGILYDSRSRPVIREHHQLFNIDSWGQAIPKKRAELTERQLAVFDFIMDTYYPTFEVEYPIPPSLPKMKKKLPKSPLQRIFGTEFSLKTAVGFVLFMWLASAYVFWLFQFLNYPTTPTNRIKGIMDDPVSFMLFIPVKEWGKDTITVKFEKKAEEKFNVIEWKK